MIGIKGIAKKPITDATATAESIVSGKIAYNNNGRITGALDISQLPKSTVITIPIATYTWTYSYDDHVSIPRTHGYMYSMTDKTFEQCDDGSVSIYIGKSILINKTSLTNLNIKNILGYSYFNTNENIQYTSYTQWKSPTTYVYETMNLPITTRGADIASNRIVRWGMYTSNAPISVYITVNTICLIAGYSGNDVVGEAVINKEIPITIYYK